MLKSTAHMKRFIQAVAHDALATAVTIPQANVCLNAVGKEIQLTKLEYAEAQRKRAIEAKPLPLGG